MNSASLPKRLADLLELLVHGARDVGIGNLDLEVLGLLQEELLVDELVDDAYHERAEARAVGGERDPFLALRNEALLQIRLRDDHVADDGDDAVELNQLLGGARGLQRRRRGRLRAKRGAGRRLRRPRRR